MEDARTSKKIIKSTINEEYYSFYGRTKVLGDLRTMIVTGWVTGLGNALSGGES